jgi:hypothetical protein
MSTLDVIPEALATASGDLAAIGSSLNEANSIAALPTAAITPAAADEVSAAIAALFSGHGQFWQGVAAQAQEVHQQFVQNLNSAANWYATTEAANVPALEQNASAAINAPTEALFNRPLLGNGADGTAAHPNGYPGGFLYGSGGNGFSPATGAGGNGGSGGLIGNGGIGGHGGASVADGAQGGAGGNGGLLWGTGGAGGAGGAGGVGGGDGGTGGLGGLLWGGGGSGGFGGDAGTGDGGSGGQGGDAGPLFGYGGNGGYGGDGAGGGGSGGIGGSGGLLQPAGHNGLDGSKI